jgi:hypothetical protein
MPHPIQAHGGFGHLGQLFRRFEGDGVAVLQRVFNGAKLAAFAFAPPADTALRNRCG